MKNLIYNKEIEQSVDLFSIIVISYNNLKYIFNCLDSILNQTYKNIELIIADDSSIEYNENDIFNYIKEKKKNNLSRLILFSNDANLGTVKNINKALRLCSGDYIKVLACDDALFCGDVLSNAMFYLKQSKFGIISSNIYKCDSVSFNILGKYNNSFVEKSAEKSSLFFLKANCKHNRILAPSIFFTKHFFAKYGLFDEDCILVEDWSKWLQIFDAGAIIQYCDFDSVKYRFDTGVGRSTNKVLLADKRVIFDKYIKANKKKIGFWCYFISELQFKLRTSLLVRKVYSLLKR